MTGMGRRARITGILATAGALACLAAYLVVQHNRSASSASGPIVTLFDIPDGHRLDGEAIVGNTLYSLKNDNGNLFAEDLPQALSLRLRDDRQHYYDIDIARTITLSGLAPRTPVTVLADNKTIHDAIPADWNGRITLDAPRTAPFDISFSQNNHDYRIGITRMIGGAS